MLGSSYMNATLVDSYLKRGAHIITQAPMEDTVVDFWRMVWDKKVCVIANLLTDKEIDEVRFCRFSCILYWSIFREWPLKYDVADMKFCEGPG